MEEKSLVAEVLTYCDRTTDACGEQVAASALLSEVVIWYGAADPVGRAVRRSRAALRIKVLLAAVTQRLSLESARAAALELDEAAELPEFSEMLLVPKG